MQAIKTGKSQNTPVRIGETGIKRCKGRKCSVARRCTKLFHLSYVSVKDLKEKVKCIMVKPSCVCMFLCARHKF